MRSLYRGFGVYSVSVLGVGLLIRAAVHGQSGRGGKLLDGIGKLVGVLGWTLGLVTAVLFAWGEVKEDAQFGLMQDAFTLFFWPGVAVLLLSLIPRDWGPGYTKPE